MSCWHTRECKTPRVAVREDGLPECRTCDGVVPLVEIITQHEARGSSELVVPADEPLGQLDLRWPPCLPWSDGPEALADILNSGATKRLLQLRSEVSTPVLQTSGSRHPDNHEDTRGDGMTNGCSNTSPAALSPKDHSPKALGSPVGDASPTLVAHPLPLQPHEIRLLRLTESTNAEDPVHGTFEVYSHDDCPEYETVSYTWTNEDGTSLPWKPVYIGEHWDVKVVARNCWAVLCYLRPRHSSRLIWIDVLCINQSDTGERGSQVARMGEIYSRCMRTIVWLGDDVIKTPSRMTYRPRRDFKNILEVLDDPDALANILKRRYFTRVWVIQELVLAPQSIIPVGEVDFYARLDSAEHIAKLLKIKNTYWIGSPWGATSTPWLSQMHQSHLITDYTLRNALKITWNDSMQTTDPRDKVYGVLGLCADGLKPDYTISLQSTLLGTILYILIKLNCWDGLPFAPGVSAEAHRPSWAPTIQKLLLYDRIDIASSSYSGPYDMDIQFPSTWQNATYSLIIPWLSRLLATIIFRRRPEKSKADRRASLSEHYEWDPCITISRKGALSMKLAHLARIVQRPKISPHQLKFEAANHLLLLNLKGAEFDKGLRELSETGTDHLFISDPGGDALDLQVMLMRETSIPTVYRLITCCICWDVRILSKSPVRHQGLLLGPARYATEAMSDRSYQFPTGGKIGQVFWPRPWRSLGAALEDFNTVLNTYCSEWQQQQTPVSKFSLMGGFYQEAQRHSLSEETTLQFLQVIIDDELEGDLERTANGPQHTRFAQVYLETLSAQTSIACTSITRDAEYIIIEMSGSLGEIDNDGGREGLWCANRGEGKWEPLRRWISKDDLTTDICVRAKVHDLAEWCKESLLYMEYTTLVAYCSVTGESVPQMLSRDIRAEDYDIFPRIWPQEAVEQLGLDEKLEQVWII